MFGTVFGQSRTVFEIGFGPWSDIFGFCYVFLVFRDIYSLKQRFGDKRNQNGSLL